MVDAVQQEFDDWYTSQNEMSMFLLDAPQVKTGRVMLDLSFSVGDAQFSVRCPKDYPQHKKSASFEVLSTDRVLTHWLRKMQDYCSATVPTKSGSTCCMCLADVLNKAAQLWTNGNHNASDALSDDENMEMDIDPYFFEQRKPSSSVKTTTQDSALPASSKDDIETHDCVICMDSLDNGEDSIEELPKCKHRFHKGCIQEHFKRSNPQCPICKTQHGIPQGNQPPGSMHQQVSKGQIAGFNCSEMIIINYSIPSGIQGPNHPHPGQVFHGTSRTAYLPNTAEGQLVAKLLRLAFDHSLIFTVGMSATTGADNQVIWNGIHHKTSLHGGSAAYGYPDEKYLFRVEEELASVGITRDMIK